MIAAKTYRNCGKETSSGIDQCSSSSIYDCHTVAAILCQRTSLQIDQRVPLLGSAFDQSGWNKLVCSFARSLKLHEFHWVIHR